MKKYYDSSKNRLVCIGQASSNIFWDEHWKTTNFEILFKIIRSNQFIIKITKKYLPPGSKILEGGCGRGDKVYVLSKSGYDVYGVDWAKRTVDLINKFAPELKVTCQDVRSLNFEDNFFDGYWSLGVIEHFYEGYEAVIKEAYRVIKKNGILFLTFPSMSILRKIKAKMGFYITYNENEDAKRNFYQFVLDEKEVIGKLSAIGFKLLKKGRYDGVIGLKDEIPIVKPIFQRLYDSPNFFLRVIKYSLNSLINQLTGHISLLILKKT